MTYSSRREKIVGGLTFLALVIAIFASYGGADSAVDESIYQVSATFGRIDGLAEEAEVRMGGVLIGQVMKADLDQNYRAVVTMGIHKDVKLPLDTSAAIQTDGLFGAKFIELEPGGEEEMMVNGSVIDMAQSSVVVEELLELIISEGKSKRAQQQDQ
ncbi:MlaD family protein [Terasakiella sp. SH-1]|uniref:MlaD family protein n=1 Tax=Terasakiella sp. SH-1 TaxID=2560057 RepID=UPI0010743EED|nr:MlaD family protein [Terasakiella sp. SH-1]